jgi:hypothetical protein
VLRSWRSDRNPNGPKPLADSVERSLGREIERDPRQARGAAQISYVCFTGSRHAQNGANDAMGQPETPALQNRRPAPQGQMKARGVPGQAGRDMLFDQQLQGTGADGIAWSECGAGCQSGNEFRRGRQSSHLPCR